MHVVHQFKNRKATSSHPFQFFRSGLSNVYLTGIAYAVCRCGMREASYPLPLKMMSTLAKLVFEKTTRLTPLEIRFLRKSLGKDHKGFAQLVGVTVTQVSRWENGKSKPSNSAEKLIRCLAGGTNLETPAEFKESERYTLHFEKSKWNGEFQAQHR